MDPVTILLFIIVILFLVKTYNEQKNQKYKNFPPGPKPLPFIGSLHVIDLQKPHYAFMKLSEEYGSVFSIQLGIEKMVVLCGYDTVKDALINHAEEFYERPNTAIIARTSHGNGILFAHGENWKVMKRFTLSTLRDFGMGRRSIENKINEEAQCLMQELKSYKGEPFENMTIVNAAVANIIVSILLGDRFEYGDPTILKLMRIINENIRSFGTIMIRGKPESTLYFHNDNLGMLVSDLFVAGMETTSTTLRWGLLLMIKNPEIQKKVQNEIDRVIGSAEPKIEHRKQMPYTDAVIHEIQRFADILPLNVPHATAKDVTFRGYNIPKGTTIIPLLTSVLRDKAYFEKPDEFYPEHFLDSRGNLKKNEAFIPFSLGKRSCAGENLAKMELFLFFTTLLQNFTFQAPPGAKLDLTPALGFTNAPLPHKICAIPRC
ncbi:cytochrome P450 2K1-like isoform X2 [Aquarana catesbeiana]|uniref:cytochrome P450 2K1-like isoform X2 n=1 Tax=Aquarana catesbeiana TaxID=8400 RepID=UPI003CCA4B24